MKALTKNILMTTVGVIASSLIFVGYASAFNYDKNHHVSMPIQMAKTTQFNNFVDLPK